MADGQAGIPDFRKRPLLDVSWYDRAACRGEPTDLWFPERGESLEIARRICRSCPVAKACLEYAFAGNERIGMYGGWSERERRKVRVKWRNGWRPDGWNDEPQSEVG